MNIMAIIFVAFACYGIYWGYPKLPPPGGLILVIVVICVCVAVLLNFAGINTGLHFSN